LYFICCSNDGVLDVGAVIQLWARRMVEVTGDPVNSSSDIQYDISYNKARIQHGEPSFQDAARPPSPKSTVLFKSTYRNASEQEQTNIFRAERSTTSRAELTVLEGVCLPQDGVRVPLPADVAAANAGFPPTLSVCKQERKCWEEKLTWAVDTRITVAGGQTTHAQMVVEEKQWSGDFTIRSTLSGKVKAVARNRLTGKLITTSTGELSTIFDDAQKEGLNVPGMTIEGGDVVFVTRGELNFRYGVEQRVNIENTS
jgi:hypothetical protein